MLSFCGDNLCDAQAIIIQHNTEQQLHTGNIVVKTAIKKCIVHETKPLDSIKIHLFVSLKHYITLPHTIYFYFIWIRPLFQATFCRETSVHRNALQLSVWRPHLHLIRASKELRHFLRKEYDPRRQQAGTRSFIAKYTK